MMIDGRNAALHPAFHPVNLVNPVRSFSLLGAAWLRIAGWGGTVRADILVCYDVNTEDSAGRRRLRQVAKACTSYGQRVQFSVFECTVNEMQMLTLRKRLLGIIDTDKDNLRVYHLHGERSKYLEAFGRDRYVDFGEPLVV